MPFAPSGVYTPPLGAENATPSQVIRSATWNTIFTDISAALTSLGKQVLAAPRVVSTPGSFAVAVDDALILVGASCPTITLPAGATKVGPVKIVGSASGIFGSNNSAVVVAGAETISGLGTLTLSQDYQVLNLQPLAGGGYVVV